jgi:hypothetical protein
MRVDLADVGLLVLCIVAFDVRWQAVDEPPCLSTPPPEAPAVAVYTTSRDEIEAMLRERVHALEVWSQLAWKECGSGD